MTKTTITLAAMTLLGGLALGAGSASAAPMAVEGFQSGRSEITQVRMMKNDRMMMKKRMMKKRMMKKRMMNRM